MLRTDLYAQRLGLRPSWRGGDNHGSTAERDRPITYVTPLGAGCYGTPRGWGCYGTHAWVEGVVRSAYERLRASEDRQPRRALREGALLGVLA